MGAFVVGKARGESFAHCGADLVLAFTGHQRAPRVVGCQTGDRPLLRRLKPDRQPAAKHIVHVGGVAGSATSASHHHIAEFTRLAEHGRFHPAEFILPLSGENVADTEPEPLLDVEIEVDEFPVHGAGERAAECGLAAGHVAYDEYGSFGAYVHKFEINNPAVSYKSGRMKFLNTNHPIMTAVTATITGMELMRR